MNKSPKDSSKRGKAAARKAPRRVEAVRPASTERTEFHPVYGWREEGDPPDVIRQGTLEELGERQRAGARTSSVSVIAPYGAVNRPVTRRATTLLHRWMKKGAAEQGAAGDTLCEAANRMRAEAGKTRRTTVLVVEDAPRPAKRGELPAGPGTVAVAVPADLLRAARERTGKEDDAELVAFALSMLAQSDPGEETFNAMLGSLPGLELYT